jgi:hypothetical protein
MRACAGEHLAARAATRASAVSGGFRARGGRRGERGFHLRQRRQVGLLQHQADVRVRDQVAVLVDDVGVALLATLICCTTSQMNFRFTVDRGHARAFAPGAHRDRHVGLGLLAEIHRAEIGLARASPP